MTDRRALVLLLLLAALTHGLLALNTGLYWDDYVICNWLEERDWPRFYELGDTMGNLGLTYLYWPFVVSANPCGALKIGVLLSLLGTACFVYLTARESGLVDPFGAFFVAAVAVIYPGHMMTFAANIAGHFFCYFAFALGAWCALRSERRAGGPRIAYRIASYASFIVSYFTPSFLVFHFGFLLLLFVCCEELSARTAIRSALSFLRRQWDLWVLPFAYWAVHEQVNPVHGWARQWGYNEIRLEPGRILDVYGSLLRVVGHSWLYYLEPFVACVAVLSALIWLARRFRRVPMPGRANAAHAAFALALGTVWILLAAFPYAVVGKGFGAPAIVDWSTRNQLLLQLPLALIVLGIAGLVLGRWPELRAAALGAVLAFSVAIRIDTYLEWQAQAIKDESIRHHLARQAAKYHLLVIHDRYVMVDAGKYINDIPLWWSYVLRLALGDFTRFGVYERDLNTARSTRRFTEKDVARIWLRDRVHPARFDPSAPQASVIVERGPHAGKYRLVVPYYLARLQGNESLQHFLSGVTRISLIERR